MQPYYELAYALNSKSLCFFVGTGFSKYITDGQAPSWDQLLKDCCGELPNGVDLVNELFPAGKPLMALEECASIIALQMKKNKKDLNKEMAIKLKDLKLSDKAKNVKEFCKKYKVKFVTTNYDLLIEDEIYKNEASVFCPGFPVSRRRELAKVYHLHGAVKWPEEMVVTADDYYKFISFPNYFSKKLDTILEENTTVIIGYSLGDINFKQILNRHRSDRGKINKHQLFFLSRKNVSQYLKDYYDYSYGIRVIDGTDIDSFLSKLDHMHDAYENEFHSLKETLIEVIHQRSRYTDWYIKKRNSFFEIISTLNSVGVRIEHPTVQNMIKDLFKRKVSFSTEFHAWSQYSDLSEWLIYLGSIFEIKGSSLEDLFIETVTYSFDKMSKEREAGMSWDSFQVWKKGWSMMTYQNRSLIRRNLSQKSFSKDTKEIIESC